MRSTMTMDAISKTSPAACHFAHQHTDLKPHKIFFRNPIRSSMTRSPVLSSRIFYRNVWIRDRRREFPYLPRDLPPWAFFDPHHHHGSVGKFTTDRMTGTSNLRPLSVCDIKSLRLLGSLRFIVMSVRTDRKPGGRRKNEGNWSRAARQFKQKASDPGLV